MYSPSPPPEIRVAVTQAEPIWLDLDETVLKTIKLIIEAAAHGAQLITFPECWIPGYPAWIWSRPVDFDLTTLYTKNSMAVDSPHMRTLCDSARCNNIAVALGFSENYNNSLYIAQALISSDGKLSMTRRKLKPTHMERTIFGEGTGNSLHNVVDVNGVGKVGQLACWEHAQPLLKYHTCLQNEDVHVSAWPPVYEHRGGKGLWSLSREGCRNLSQTHAIESQSFVLHTTSVITQPGIDRLRTSETSLFGAPGGGSSAIFGPDGRQLSEDIPETMEGILYADLDFDEILRAKSFLDVCGHGSRSDMLWLSVDDREKAPLKRQRTREDFGGGTLTGGSPPPKPCDKPLVFSWMNQT